MIWIESIFKEKRKKNKKSGVSLSQRSLSGLTGQRRTLLGFKPNKLILFSLIFTRKTELLNYTMD